MNSKQNINNNYLKLIVVMLFLLIGQVSAEERISSSKEDEMVFEHYREYIHSVDSQKKRAAISYFSFLADRGMTLIIECLNDEDKDIRSVASTALHRMTGVSFGYDGDKARKWLKDNPGKIQLLYENRFKANKVDVGRE